MHETLPIIRLAGVFARSVYGLAKTTLVESTANIMCAALESSPELAEAFKWRRYRSWATQRLERHHTVQAPGNSEVN